MSSVFPVLAGRPGGYQSGKFDAWRDGERSNDPLALMKVGFGAVLRGPAARCRSPLGPGDAATRAYRSSAAVAVFAATSMSRFPAFVSIMELTQRLGMLMVSVPIVVGGAMLVAHSVKRLCFPCLSHPRRLEGGRRGGAARHPGRGPL